MGPRKAAPFEGQCVCGLPSTHVITYDDHVQHKVVQLLYSCEDCGRNVLRSVGWARHGFLGLPDEQCKLFERRWREHVEER